MERVRRLAWIVVLSGVVLIVAAAANASSPGSTDTTSTETISHDVAVEEPTDVPDPKVSATPEPAEQEDEGGEEASEDGDDFNTENHGFYVSKVKKCVPEEPEHGKAVWEMARTHENEAEKATELCEAEDEIEEDEIEAEDGQKGEVKSEHKPHKGEHRSYKAKEKSHKDEHRSYKAKEKSHKDEHRSYKAKEKSHKDEHEDDD